MDYKIVYSDRKTLSLQVTRLGEVVVKAPRRIAKTRIEAFATAHTDWIEKKLCEVKGRLEKYPEPSENEYRELISLAKSTIPSRVEYFAKIMGVSPQKISINRAKTRFGSCSSKGNLNFSCRVMRYPPDAIDYVVVHELAHLTHFNHSKSFWALVEKVLPDYKERKRLLK